MIWGIVQSLLNFYTCDTNGQEYQNLLSPYPKLPNADAGLSGDFEQSMTWTNIK